MIRIVLSLLLVFASMNSIANTSLTYGRFSPIYAELNQQPILFENQASLYVQFDVHAFNPVTRGMPLSYYQNALPDTKKCKVSVPFFLRKNQILSLKKATIQCPVNSRFGYVGKVNLVISYFDPSVGKYVELTCKGDECRRFVLPNGRYLLRIAEDSKLTYQELGS